MPVLTASERDAPPEREKSRPLRLALCAALGGLLLLPALAAWTAWHCRQTRSLLVVGRYGIAGPDVRAHATMTAGKLVMRGHTYSNARYHDFGPAGSGLELFSFGGLYVVELSTVGGGSRTLSRGGGSAPAPPGGSGPGGR